MMAAYALAVLAVDSAFASHTATVAISETNLVDGVAASLTLSFANHANETNGLWVAYGQEDSETTNGWNFVQFVATIPPETNSITYTMPAGWGGETLHAIRFFLSEVPYDVDCTLSYLYSDKASGSKAQGVILTGFSLKGTDRVQTRVSFDTVTPGRAQGVFCARPSSSTGKAPYFNVFLMDGGKFRLDYNSNTVTSVSTRSANTFYDLDVSQEDGLLVDGVSDIAAPDSSRRFTSNASGTPFLFGGKATAVSSAAKMKMQYFRVLSSAGVTRLDLVPVLKDGEPAFYDVVGGKFYYSISSSPFVPLTAGPRIESAEPFFATAAYEVAIAAGTTVFATPTPLDVAQNYTNPAGGILLGPCALTLTGLNDFGGQFVVSNGTLVAAFGQGLAATDNLLLAGGAYCDPSGRVTASLGSSGGQIAFTSEHPGGFSAVGGDLDVDIGGNQEAVTYTGAPGRLVMNDPNATGTLRVKNPIVLTRTLNVTNSASTVVFEAPITGDRGEGGDSLYTWGDYTDGGLMVFAANHSYMTYYQRGGNSLFAAGTTNILGGNFYLAEHGTLVMTNSVLELRNEAGLSNGFRINSGDAQVYGSKLTCRGGVVGMNENQSSANAAGLRFEGSDVTVNGDVTIERSAASAALCLYNGSKMTVSGTLSIVQRNIYIRDSSLYVSKGIRDTGREGTARCTLYEGGVLETKSLTRADNGTNTTHISEMVFAGGTLRQIAAANPVIVNPFAVYVAGAKGGVFESDYDTAFAPLLQTAKKDLGHSNEWDFSPVDYLQAPAFTKRGSGRLTVSGVATYACATAVEGGTLTLAENAALPSTTVLRMGGGTLDLGGAAQTVRALASTGTVGVVTNGALTVTEGVYPGGAGGIGVVNVAAALTGPFICDVQADGACDCLNAIGTLNLSTIDLQLGDAATFPTSGLSMRIVKGPTTGAFRSVPQLPKGWTVSVRADGVYLGRSGFMFIIR